MNIFFVIRCAVIIFLWSVLSLTCMDKLLTKYDKETVELITKASLHLDIDLNKSTQKISLAEAKKMFPNFKFFEESNIVKEIVKTLGEDFDDRIRMIPVTVSSSLKNSPRISLWLPHKFILNEDPAIDICDEESVEPITFSVYPSKKAPLRQAVMCKIESEYSNELTKIMLEERSIAYKANEEMIKKHADDMKKGYEDFKKDLASNSETYRKALENERERNNETLKIKDSEISRLLNKIKSLEEQIRHDKIILESHATETAILNEQMLEQLSKNEKILKQSLEASSLLDVTLKMSNKAVWQRDCWAIATVLMTCLMGLLMGYIYKHRLLPIV